MESKFHRWWLGSCVAALLLASWVGGFSLAVTAVFTVIYLTGVTLIGPDEAPSDPVDVVAADQDWEPVDVVAADPDWDSDIVEIAAESDGVAEVPADAEVPVEPEVEAVVPVEPAPVLNEDDAVPYPDDFESTAVVVDGRSPA